MNLRDIENKSEKKEVVLLLIEGKLGIPRINRWDNYILINDKKKSRLPCSSIT